MTNQATFKESSRKRPLIQRLTPVAWLLIGVLALSCVACGVVGATQVAPTLIGPDDEWATNTPEPTAAETAVEPTEAPTVVPTDEWGRTATPEPTGEPTAAGDPFPAWWADEMTQDENGVWWPPDEVVEMVKDHHWEAYRVWWEIPFQTTPPDLDAVEEALPKWKSGPSLEQNLADLEDMRAAIEEDRPARAPLRKKVWQECYQHVECKEDGLTCRVALTCFDGVVETYDPGTGEIIDTEHQDNSGILIVDMRYDPIDGHWKVHEFLAWRVLEE